MRPSTWRSAASISTVILVSVTAAFSQGTAHQPDQWSGSVQCQIAVQQPGYVRQEVQTWTLTGEPPRVAGGTGVWMYPATWTYQGQGQLQRQDGTRMTIAQWNINIIPGEAPFSFAVRDGVLTVKRASGQQKRYQGFTGQRQIAVNGMAQAPTPMTSSTLWEWPLSWIEAAPGSNVSGTMNVPTENINGEIQQQGPPPFATCRYQFTKAGGNLTPVAGSCAPAGSIAQTFETMKTNLARDFDALLQQVQDPARRAALNAQKQRLLRELEALKQQNVGANSAACQGQSGTNTANSGGGTGAPGTPPGQNPPNQSPPASSQPGNNQPTQTAGGNSQSGGNSPDPRSAIPQLVSISPNSVDQGSSNVQVALTAHGTNWQMGTTKVDFGPGITPVAGPFVTAAGEAYVVLAVAADAPAGPRSVTVTSNNESVGMPSAFAVNAKPSVSQVAGATSPNNALSSAGSKTVYEAGKPVFTAALDPQGGATQNTPSDPSSNNSVLSNATVTPVITTPTLTTSSTASSPTANFSTRTPSAGQSIDRKALAPHAAPTGFAAKHLGTGSVQFTWQPVSGATQYYFEGTGIASGGIKVAASSNGVTITGVPPGAGSWKMAAVYGGSWDPNLMATASTMVRYVPPHSPAWLSKFGQGNAALTIQHYLSLCTGCVPGISWSRFLELIGGVGERIGYGCSTANNGYDTGCPEPPYKNVTDLGTNRSTACYALALAQGTSLGGTLCYTRSGDQGLTVIVTRQNQWWFLAFSGPNPSGPYTLTDRATFDSEGPKFAPHACLACHGGQSNPNGPVSGATLLPLDPGLLQISTVTTTENGTYYPNTHPVEWVAETLIRPLNTQVVMQNSSPAVKRYLHGIYGNDLNGATNPDFVPQGWANQTGLYRQVIKPHCIMCHLSSNSTVDFSSFDTLMRSKDQVHAAVCGTRSMPHSEIAFQDFWGKDTGSVFLPGVLDATLGFKSCP